MTISIVVADDHEVVRSGLASMLKGSDITIVAEATSAEEAVSQTASHKPDVVLLDIRLGDVDGLTALEKIHKKVPGTRVVMLSTYDNPTYVTRSVALGASDYVLKGATRSELVRAIRRAASDAGEDSSSILERVQRTIAKGTSERDEQKPLTNREHQVLKQIALGLSNREIGRALEIGVETVKEHVQNILRKLNATGRTQAAVWAVKKGLA